MTAVATTSMRQGISNRRGRNESTGFYRFGFAEPHRRAPANRGARNPSAIGKFGVPQCDGTGLSGYDVQLQGVCFGRRRPDRSMLFGLQRQDGLLQGFGTLRLLQGGGTGIATVVAELRSRAQRQVCWLLKFHRENIRWACRVTVRMHRTTKRH